MKKTTYFVLILALTMSLFTYSFADSTQPENHVKLLYELGILKGNGGGISSIDAEKPITRLSAAIITLRLLGLEEEATSYSGKNNFADINDTFWAKPIISYLHDNPSFGWSNEDNLFNPDQPVTNKFFTEKLLSVLKYEDYSDDMLVSYASSIGLQGASDKVVINLEEAALLVTEALNAKINNSKITLAEYLVENGKIDRNAADLTGLVKKIDNNILTMAVAWKQTAAEYKALYYQGFNIARNLVDEAIKNQKPGDKPLAIVTDMDDTILSPVNYWGYLIENNIDFFDDDIWDEWIPENKLIATAGSLEFLNYCKENNVEVFYVTSRDQGEGTYEFAMGNLKAIGFPYADEEHLTVLTDTSNKENKQKEIAQKYNIVALLGDNLNDFKRVYYVKDVDERTRLMSEDKDLFGSKFVLFPNPTDGHWIAAIFGESEPPSSNANREVWENAAMKSKWQPK